MKPAFSLFFAEDLSAGNTAYDEAKSKEYAAIKFKLSLGSTFVKALLVVLFLFSGYSLALREFAESYTSNYYGVIVLYVVILSLVADILFLPLDFYSGYRLEHRYGLSNQTIARFFAEFFKEFFLGLFFNCAVLALLYFFLHNYPDVWWIVSYGVLLVLMVVLANLAPTLIFPLFYTFTPLQNEELKERLTRLSERFGVTVNGVFEMDMSKNTKKANAALTGLGNTRRIILSDTLLKEFSPDEIEAVIAHELGHKNHHHLWKLMGVQAVMLFAVFFSIDRLLTATMGTFGFRGIDDIAGLPLFFLTLGGISLLAMPFVNGLSRFFEVQADTFALKATENAGAFVAVMERLALMNLAEKEPHPLKEFLFYSHPSIGKRIEWARRFKES